MHIKHIYFLVIGGGVSKIRHNFEGVCDSWRLLNGITISTHSKTKILRPPLYVFISSLILSIL